jgi:hypothetical protein
MKLAWIREDNKTILSINQNVITQNPRIAVTHLDYQIWYLHIREVEESDRGWYNCQVNTDPIIYQQTYLQVVGKGSKDVSFYCQWHLTQKNCVLFSSACYRRIDD